jgi:hypothetical protein
LMPVSQVLPRFFKHLLSPRLSSPALTPNSKVHQPSPQISSPAETRHHPVSPRSVLNFPVQPRLNLPFQSRSS